MTAGGSEAVSTSPLSRVLPPEVEARYTDAQLHEIIAWMLVHTTGKLRGSHWMTILRHTRAACPSLPLTTQTLVIRHVVKHAADCGVGGTVEVIQAMAAAQYRDALTFRDLLHALSAPSPPLSAHEELPTPSSTEETSRGAMGAARLSLEQLAAVAVAARELQLTPYLERTHLLSSTRLQLPPITPGQSAREPGVHGLLRILQSCSMTGRRAISRSTTTLCDVAEHADLGTVPLGALLALLSLFTSDGGLAAGASHTTATRRTSDETATTTHGDSTSEHDRTVCELSPSRQTQQRRQRAGVFRERIVGELIRRIHLLHEAANTTRTPRSASNSSGGGGADSAALGSGCATSKPDGADLNQVNIEDIVTAIESCTEPDMVTLLLRLFDVTDSNEMSASQVMRINNACQRFAHCPSILFRIIGKPLIRALPGMSVHAVLKWLMLYMSNNVRDDSVGKALVRRVVNNMSYLPKDDIAKLRRAGAFYGVNIRQSTSHKLK